MEEKAKEITVYDTEGNVLAEKPNELIDVTTRMKASAAQDKFASLFEMAKTSKEGMDFLVSNLDQIEESMCQLLPSHSCTRQGEHEALIGCSIPNEVQVYPPTDILAKGRCKRILVHGDKEKKTNGVQKKKKEAVARKCKTCNQVGFHDRRNCPNKPAQAS